MTVLTQKNVHDFKIGVVEMGCLALSSGANDPENVAGAPDLGGGGRVSVTSGLWQGKRGVARKEHQRTVFPAIGSSGSQLRFQDRQGRRVLEATALTNSALGRGCGGIL